MSGPLPKPWVAAMTPYKPGRADGIDGRPAAKLSSNENPLGTSPAARAALAEAAGTLHRYPDPSASGLRAAIAAQHRLDPERVICGTGSDELLHLAPAAFAGVGDEVLHARFSFLVYPLAARRVGATPVEAPDRDHAADIDAMIGALSERTRVVFLANPNNPTGEYLRRDAIARLHDAMPPECLLVVDQAYAEYLAPGEDDGAFELAKSALNILITRTFSKIYGLASERIGWGYGPASVIEALGKVRAPFNVTQAGQAAAIAALGDQGFVETSRAHNARWRAWLADEIAALGNAGLRALPSEANFLMVLFEGALSAEAAHDGLAERGLLVRWLPGQGLGHALRITIGTEDQVRAVAAALREMVGERA
ncbi:MAG: histidinol-phosphate transaminase [Sphingomonadaceae bacterium]|nr:histidinol-phosphate transaminase [Sphingomonadaceae bacterium]